MLLAASERGPVQATKRIVPPYLYRAVWSIAVHGPLTASEIAEDVNRREAIQYLHWTPQQAANRMRILARLGLIMRDGDGFYLLTPAGRTWITTGAER